MPKYRHLWQECEVTEKLFAEKIDLSHPHERLSVLQLPWYICHTKPSSFTPVVHYFLVPGCLPKRTNPDSME
jgi:hypothetical protein